VGRSNIQYPEDEEPEPEKETVLFRRRKFHRNGHELLPEEKLQNGVLHEPRGATLRLLFGVHVRPDES